MALRKFNTIEHYFDRNEDIDLLPGSNYDSIHPMSNIQTVLYANFVDAVPGNIMEVTISTEINGNTVTLDRKPMNYVGKVIFNDIEFHRWELLITDDITSVAKPDKSTTIGIQYTEREVSNFIGIEDTYSDVLAITDAENGDVVWVSDGIDATYPASTHGNRAYQYDETDGWVEQESFDNYGAIWGSTLVETTVGRGVMGSKSTIQTDTTDLVMKALADVQANRMLKDGSNSEVIEMTFVDGEDEYKLSYNAQNGTLDLSLRNGVTLQVGQENLAYVRNTNDFKLEEGTAVTLSDTTGDRPIAVPINPSDDTSARGTIGIVTSDEGIAKNAFGYIATFGMVRELNTSFFDEGDFLYAGSNGELTNVKPTQPDNVIEIGIVVKKAEEGIVFVNPRIRDRVINLSDTEILEATADQVLVRDVNGVWRNQDSVPAHYTKTESDDRYVEQSEVDSLDTRVTANENAIDDHETRITDLRIDTDLNTSDVTLLLNALDLDTGGNV